MSTFQNQLINLNSANAIQNNGTFLSSVFFNFPSLIVPKNNIKNITCSILNAQIPYSYYNVNVYNNIFRIDNGTGIQTITLTRGNYNANSLITEIIAQLTLAGITGISIVLSSITGCLTWTTSAASMTIFSSGSTALKFLGLNSTSNTTSVVQKIISPFPLNLLYTLKIRITSTALVVNYLDSAVSGSLNVLASFSVSAPNFGIILYENQTNIQSDLKVRNLNGFDIQILDDDGNLINFNNTNWTATMMLQIEYEDEQPIEQAFNPLAYNIPNQQFWGRNPNDFSLPNVDVQPTANIPINYVDNMATEEPANGDTSTPLPTEGNAEPTELAAQQLTDPTPTDIPDNGDLGILLWNNGINL